MRVSNKYSGRAGLRASEPTGWSTSGDRVEPSSRAEQGAKGVLRMTSPKMDRGVRWSVWNRAHSLAVGVILSVAASAPVALGDVMTKVQSEHQLAVTISQYNASDDVPVYDVRQLAAVQGTPSASASSVTTSFDDGPYAYASGGNAGTDYSQTTLSLDPIHQGTYARTAAREILWSGGAYLQTPLELSLVSNGESATPQQFSVFSSLAFTFQPSADGLFLPTLDTQIELNYALTGTAGVDDFAANFRLSRSIEIIEFDSTEEQAIGQTLALLDDFSLNHFQSTDPGQLLINDNDWSNAPPAPLTLRADRHYQVLIQWAANGVIQGQGTGQLLSSTNLTLVAVPEPSSIALIALGATSMLWRTARNRPSKPHRTLHG